MEISYEVNESIESWRGACFASCCRNANAGADGYGV